MSHHALAVVAPSRALDDLGEAIASLAAQLHAATYELLLLLREFDERHGWNHGFLSCAHWLSWRTGIDAGAAREKVRVARALAALPQISTAMRSGRLSFSKVRALTRVARPDTERALLDVALTTTAAQFERLVRAWRRTRRTIPPTIRRVLDARDVGCRFPGCRSRRRCDAHHIEHWADGGSTRLDNLLLLCRRHHRAVHEGVVTIVQDAGGDVSFCRRDGRRIEQAPAPLPLSGMSLQRQPHVVAGSSLPTRDGTSFDVGYAIDVIYRPPT